jgi:hypothetical protein
MSYATTTITFSDGQQITSARLNEIISGFRLASDSVDATTITLSSGVLSVGVLGAANYGLLSIPTGALADLVITNGKLGLLSVATGNIQLLAITGSLIAETTIGWTKTLTADRAVQADMQSETAAHFVSPDVLKYHPGVAKAYGTVAFENGVATVTGGYNVTSASDTGSAREVTLAITMADTNYVVDVTGNGGGAPWAVTGKTTTKFTVDGPTEASGRTFSFKVHGQRAT